MCPIKAQVGRSQARILKDVNPLKIMLIMYCYMSIINISICNQLLNGISY